MIYILGSDEKSLYLACKIKESGFDTTILTTKQEPCKNKAITIKEEGKFNKKTINIDINNYPKEKAEYLFITAPIQDLKSELIAIYKTKFEESRIICLSGLKSAEELAPYFGKDINICYMKGHFNHKQESINILGEGPSITTYPHTPKDIVELLEKAQITTQQVSDQTFSFWQHFATDSILFLLHNIYKKGSIDLLKNKDIRQTIENLVSEIATIAKQQTSKDIKESVISSIYSAPNNANIPFSFAYINFINRTMAPYSASKNELNKLIKTIYNKKLI